MYKDILTKLNSDRRIDRNFMERLEKNGFEIKYGTFEYWQQQEYIQIGKTEIWLVTSYGINNSMACIFRYRNEVVEEIKLAIELEKKELEKELKLTDEILKNK